MKKYIYILACILIYQSCKSQEKSLEYEHKNLIIFKDLDPKIKVIDNNMSEHLLTYKNLTFVKDNKYSDIRYPLKLSFAKDRDTMNIIFGYGNGKNVYINSLEFKKGNYQIIVDIYSNPKKYLLKKQEIPKQKIISKNVLIKKEHIRKDIELKDMIFYEVNLKDTINSKIEKQN
ncbi:hypothetical protein SL053_002049 [Flavobacterium psychrophilum]|nr:hypothetical protein [Flavobacterium psychrophilum]